MIKKLINIATADIKGNKLCRSETCRQWYLWR